MEKTKRVIRGKSHQSPETRRAELLDAAIVCFGRTGYNTTTIDHIAKEAGLSKGSVYRFFDSKDDILLAILDKFNREINTLTEEAMASTDQPLEKIRLGLLAAISYLNQQKDMERVWAEFMYNPLAKQTFAEMLDDYRADIESLIQAGIDSGDLYDQPVRAIADTILAFHSGLHELALDDEYFDILPRFEAAWPVIERALKN